MYLKHSLNTVDFFKAIDRCQGEVLLHTKEKDILNLRSQLCRFIFAVVCSDASFFENARIECSNSFDYSILQDYLIQKGDTDGL